MNFFVYLRRIIFSAFPGGFRATPAEIRIRQPDGWVVIPRAKIQAVNHRTISHVIVRLIDGRRFVLNLCRFSPEESALVLKVLNNAQCEKVDVRSRNNKAEPFGSAAT